MISRIILVFRCPMFSTIRLRLPLPYLLVSSLLVLIFFGNVMKFDSSMNGIWYDNCVDEFLSNCFFLRRILLKKLKHYDRISNDVSNEQSSIKLQINLNLTFPLIKRFSTTRMSFQFFDKRFHESLVLDPHFLLYYS